VIRWIVLVLASHMTAMAAEHLQISADSFTANEKAGRSFFEGNVRIKRGVDELNASRVEVYIDTKRTPTKYVADGNATFYILTNENASYRGRAQRVVFLPLEEEYRFYGDVHLLQLDQHKQIDGEEIVVNLKEGTAQAKGADKRPVIMTFTLPEEPEQ